MQLVSTIVTQLSQLGLEIGFDFGIDVAYSASEWSVPVATINLSYPRRGRTVSQNNLVIDLRGALSYAFPEDGTQMGNVVYEVGASGAISVVENINPLEDGYAVFEKVLSRSMVTSANALNLLENLGLSDAALYSYPVVTPTVTLDLFNTMLPLGSFIEGDDVQLYIPSVDSLGYTFDPGFPNGMNLEWRLTQWTSTVANFGQSTLALVFNQPPAIGLPSLPPLPQSA